MSGSEKQPISNRPTAVRRILLIAFVLLFLLAAFIGNTVPLYIIYLGTPFIFAYVAYLSLKIRGGFVIRLYRNQALGIAAIAAYMVVNASLGPFLPYSPAQYTDSGSGVILFGALLNLVAGVPFLLWIDSTTRVSRKSDPYERDTLGWSRVRYIVFVGAAASAVLDLVLTPIVAATFGTYVPTVSLFANAVGNIPFAAVLLAGVLVLPLSAIRSRDITLRRHILWFAAFFAAFAVYLIISIAASLLIPGFAGSNRAFALAIALYYILTYCLYRSAKSLAPHTSRLESEVHGPN